MKLVTLESPSVKSPLYFLTSKLPTLNVSQIKLMHLKLTHVKHLTLTAIRSDVTTLNLPQTKQPSLEAPQVDL